MNFWQKLGLILLVVGTIAYMKVTFFPSAPYIPESVRSTEEVIDEPEIKQKVYVNVFFIGQNDKKEEVYRAVKREYNEEKDGTKLSFALTQLLAGPTDFEKTQNVYTEIPRTTKLMGISETDEKAVINLSSDFGNGGGTDSLYKRLYQLIKTSNKNSNTSVYLNINGKQADMIGGEGLMLNQPLNERSLAD